MIGYQWGEESEEGKYRDRRKKQNVSSLTNNSSHSEALSDTRTLLQEYIL